MKLKHLILTLLALSTYSVCLAGVPYDIYPVPHYQKIMPRTASITETVNIVADGAIDPATIERAKDILNAKGLKFTITTNTNHSSSNLYLGVGGSGGAADRQASRQKVNRKALKVADKFDRHILTISTRGGIADILILGENTDATFCGLASLEQILDNGTSDLQCVIIEDYADIKYRGVIEGYYGIPYSAEVTKDLFKFMARYKMNCYMYGAKSDPYHSQKWAEPYPDTITAKQKSIGYLSKDMMRDIVDVSHQCKVNFIWAIHPGTAFMDPNDDVVIDKIMDKFRNMYDLGVRQFGVFVDDVGVPSDEPTMKLTADRVSAVQIAVNEYWNKIGATPDDTVGPVNFVPQLYAYSWVKQAQRQKYYAALGKAHPEVLIYITGAAVWSVPNSEDLELVSSEMGRGLAWWWNYPCNDNDMTKIFIRDTYTNFANMKAIDSDARLPKNLRGANVLISNPMQQGAASKIALFGVGDYGWNNAAFDSKANYKAAIKAVAGAGMAADLEYLAGYLSYDDYTPLQKIIENYKTDNDAAPVRDELMKVLKSCQAIDKMSDSGSVSDSLLVQDIKPWLNKVSDMAYLGIRLLDAIGAPDSDSAISEKLREEVAYLDSSNRYQLEILVGMGDEISLGIRSAQPGAKVLRPFLDYLAGKMR